MLDDCYKDKMFYSIAFVILHIFPRKVGEKI